MYIKSCGINSTHTKNFRIHCPEGFDTHLFLHLKTPARFHINGKIYDAEANDIILYQKGYPQFYEAREEISYIDDYIFFDTETEQEENFVNQLALKMNQPLRLPFSSSFMNIHQIICMEYMNQQTFYKESMDCLLQYFLIKLSSSMNMDTSDTSLCDHILLERFQELRLLLYNSPDRKWTIHDMAEFVNLSPSYFQSIYRNLFHVPCVSDLISSRMNRAKDLLKTTSLTINEIAEQCGYESHIYFSRHFKKKVGITPSEYRAEHHP